jgi:hypothetical protein
VIVAVSRSLEDIRQRRAETRREFAAYLDITEQTYRRLLDRDPTIAGPTRRKIADKLGLETFLIVELVPPPTDAYLAQLTAAIDDANQNGWFAYDPATGHIGDQRVMVECPPGEAEHNP